MRRGGLIGIIGFLTLSLGSAPPPSPLSLDGGWQAVVKKALDQPDETAREAEFEDFAPVMGWLLERLWESEEPWSVFRDEAMRDLEQRQHLLRTGQRTLDRQRQNRESLLEELMRARETQRAVPRLAHRMRALRPVLPASDQLTVSVVPAPGSGTTMDRPSTIATPIVPPPYTKSQAETIEQLREELEMLAAQRAKVEEDLALIEEVAPDDFRALRSFLFAHYHRALETHRTKKERLRLSPEAPEEN